MLVSGIAITWLLRSTSTSTCVVSPGLQFGGVSSSTRSTGYSFKSGFHHRWLESASTLIRDTLAPIGLLNPTIFTVDRIGLLSSTRNRDTCPSCTRITAFIVLVSGRRQSTCCRRTVPPSLIGSLPLRSDD